MVRRTALFKRMRHWALPVNLERTERSDYNEDEQEHGRQQNKEKGLRDRAWRDAQASSNRDQDNTAVKKREAAALDA